MEAACRGFQAGEGPGVAIGLLPGPDFDGANPHLDVVLPTSMGVGRNALVVQAGDAVVAVAGQSGTLSELALAWQYGRPVLVLTSAPGLCVPYAGEPLDDRRNDRVEGFSEPAGLLDRLHQRLSSGA